MALTRNALRGMGLTEEQVSGIIEMHTETVNGLKATIDGLTDEADKNKEAIKKFEAEIEKLKTEADKAADIQKELDGYKDNEAKNKAKFDELKKQYDDFKADVETKAKKAAVDSAAKAYFESKHITGKNLNLALRAAADAIGALEMEEGKIKDTKALDDLVAGDLSGLVVKTETQGASVPTPPNNTGGKTEMTWDEIDKITNTEVRQKAMAQNMKALGLK